MGFESGPVTQGGGTTVIQTKFGPISRKETETVNEHGTAVRLTQMEARYTPSFGGGEVTLKCHGTRYKETATNEWSPVTEMTYEIRGGGRPEKGEMHLHHKEVQESTGSEDLDLWTPAKFETWIKEEYEERCQQKEVENKERKFRQLQDEARLARLGPNGWMAR